MNSKTENPVASPSHSHGDGTSTTPGHDDQLKTGAIVCVKTIPGTDELEYKALLFIANIPAHISDRELEKLLGGHLKLLGEDCHALLVRSDINATSNEVSEQFNFHEDNTQRVSFETFSQ